MSETFGHAQEFIGMDRKPGGPSCGHPHPLLEDIRCQRLKGHPGEHGSYMDAPEADMTMHWAGQHRQQEQAS